MSSVAIRSFLLYLLCSCGWKGTAQEVRLTLQPGPTTATAAGTGVAGAQGNGRPASLAQLRHPAGVSLNAGGEVVIADTENNQIRKIATDGTISIVAGTGTQGFAGEGSPATAAELDHPEALAIGPDGSIFIADTRNHRVRRIGTDGAITTLAGDGKAAFGGDGGSAAAAHLRFPAGVCVGQDGTVYIADTGNHRIRSVTPDGKIQTFAGTGEQGSYGDGGPATAAALDSPTGLAVDSLGRVLLADRRNDRVRAIDRSGLISTVPAGSAAALRRPSGITASPSGELFVAESGAHQVREISAGVSAPVLGTGQEGQFFTGVDPLVASLSSPSSVAVDANGSLMVADRGHHQVQRVSLPVLDFGIIPAGDQSQAQTITLQNGGTVPLTVVEVSLPAAFTQTAATGCGPLPRILQSNELCTLSLAFAPVAQGSSGGFATVQVTGAPPQRVRLLGDASARGDLASSSVTVKAGGSILYAGTSLALVAQVRGSVSAMPAGDIHFRDNTSAIGQATVGADGSATFSTSSLAVGTHSLDAVYSGDRNYGSSTAPALRVLVAQAPDFSLALSGAQSQSVGAGATASSAVVLQPMGGPLSQPVQLTLAGLPSGWTYSFSPRQPMLASDPIKVSLAIVTASTITAATPCILACAALLGMYVLRRSRCGLLCASVLLIFAAGCGSGGFLGGAASSSQAGQSFPLTITATAPGVTGTALVHSTTLTVVVH